MATAPENTVPPVEANGPGSAQAGENAGAAASTMAIEPADGAAPELSEKERAAACEVILQNLSGLSSEEVLEKVREFNATNPGLAAFLSNQAWMDEFFDSVKAGAIERGATNLDDLEDLREGHDKFLWAADELKAESALAQKSGSADGDTGPEPKKEEVEAQLSAIEGQIDHEQQVVEQIDQVAHVQQNAAPVLENKTDVTAVIQDTVLESPVGLPVTAEGGAQANVGAGGVRPPAKKEDIENQVRAAYEQGKEDGTKAGQQVQGGQKVSSSIGDVISTAVDGLVGGLFHRRQSAGQDKLLPRVPPVLDDEAGARNEELIRRDMLRSTLALNDREAALKAGMPFFMDKFMSAKHAHEDALNTLHVDYPKSTALLKNHGVEAVNTDPALLKQLKESLAVEGGSEKYNGLVDLVNQKETHLVDLTREAIATCEKSGNVDGLEDVMNLAQEARSHDHPLAKLKQDAEGAEALEEKKEESQSQKDKAKVDPKLDDAEKKRTDKLFERLIEMFRKLMDRMGFGKKPAP